jgi:hypothetical protein
VVEPCSLLIVTNPDPDIANQSILTTTYAI